VSPGNRLFTIDQVLGNAFGVAIRPVPIIAVILMLFAVGADSYAVPVAATFATRRANTSSRLLKECLHAKPSALPRGPVNS
jgi:hypothetical protein